MAETKKDALAAFDALIETWAVKYDKAVECLTATNPRNSTALAGFRLSGCPTARTAIHSGAVSKRLSAPYRSGPSRDWLKVKNPNRPALIRAREAEGDREVSQLAIC
jgi:hypothetical protein